ncbi:MAG TPA: Lrp/AsnC family transcriptional regulator [archaeon]|nr:Lrp/AsnC family transcriptional regulator [archaeon]
MTKIDNKDKKILYQLDTDSRQSNSNIAKNVGLSKQVVGFRIKRLVQEDIVSSFHTVVDISKLGFTIHKIFLRLQDVDKNKEVEMTNFLKQNQNVVWVASCDGRYDLAFGIWARDMEYLDRIIGEFTRLYGRHISERTIATIIHGEYFVRDYLIGKGVGTFRKSFFRAVPEKAKIDDVDWKILLELGKNSRASCADIAKLIDVSAETVANKIKKLEKFGVIRHYNIVPNESNYPYLHYKVLISLRNLTDHRYKTFVEFCRMNPNIIYIVKALGPWEAEVDIEIENADQFRKIMMDIKSRFNDVIKDYWALQVYKVHKYNFCPSIQN